MFPNPHTRTRILQYFCNDFKVLSHNHLSLILWMVIVLQLEILFYPDQLLQMVPWRINLSINLIKDFYSFLELFLLISCLCGSILYLYFCQKLGFLQKNASLCVLSPWYVLTYTTFFVFMKILYSIIHIPNWRKCRLLVIHFGRNEKKSYLFSFWNIFVMALTIFIVI